MMGTFDTCRWILEDLAATAAWIHVGPTTKGRRRKLQRCTVMGFRQLLLTLLGEECLASLVVVLFSDLIPRS
uniref:Uncharacterized protein n=1 Tax=Thermococcus sp. CIR10 TaxID=1197731 RepID=L0BAR6_9EURY|nr:hypothetical protein c10-13 [Thermococcus sp. CIR10]